FWILRSSMIPAAKTHPKNSADKGEIAMEQTFTLTIIGTEHCEWQGRFAGADASEQSFQSLPELIKLINHEFKSETESTL
ncbi:MAG: hypothetical protein RR949_08405, partial [Oscillospiraceae bacterium]